MDPLINPYWHHQVAFAHTVGRRRKVSLFFLLLFKGAKLDHFHLKREERKVVSLFVLCRAITGNRRLRQLLAGDRRSERTQLPVAGVATLVSSCLPISRVPFFFPPFYIHFISLPGGCWRLRCDLTRRAISSGSEATPGAPSYIQSGTRNSLPKEPSPFCQKDPHWPVSFSFDCRGIAEIGEERITFSTFGSFLVR